MEVKINSERKDVIDFELVGETHAFSKLLMHQLLQDKDVEVANYAIKHPLLSSPDFHVKVKKGEPRKVVLDALKALKKQTASLMK